MVEDGRSEGEPDGGGAPGRRIQLATAFIIKIHFMP